MKHKEESFEKVVEWDEKARYTLELIAVALVASGATALAGTDLFIILLMMFGFFAVIIRLGGRKVYWRKKK